MNRDILTVWQDTKSPGTVLIGPGLLLLFVDYFLFFFHVKLILVGIKEFVFKKGETLIGNNFLNHGCTSFSTSCSRGTTPCSHTLRHTDVHAG